MGNDGQRVLGELEDSLTTLSGPEMKAVVSRMATVALETARGTSDKKSNGPSAQIRH
jgi:hypothetical protein